jgi:hypothetical protein
MNDSKSNYQALKLSTPPVHVTLWRKENIGALSPSHEYRATAAKRSPSFVRMMATSDDVPG